ncbi:MAG: hypothetical protein ABW223_00460, partial [Rariglobus sp.]
GWTEINHYPSSIYASTSQTDWFWIYRSLRRVFGLRREFGEMAPLAIGFDDRPDDHASGRTVFDTGDHRAQKEMG